ncbi:MAG: L,D-transpeptidase [Solirubrobacteraceae bacterium]
MRAPRRILLSAGFVLASACTLPVQAAAASDTACSPAPGGTVVRGPTSTVAWRADIAGPTAVFHSLPGKRRHVTRWLTNTEATWVLVVGRARVSVSGCWVRVRLPWRPDGSAGWINADKVVLEQTRWRIVVSTARRTLTLFRAGAAIRTVSVVVGKPSTPTPRGLFAVWWAIPWHPHAFLGSWVLDLTAHSHVLHQFDGGDGTVAIHGRGGASLLDPLGSARSHGCVRLANDAIDWLVETIGSAQLPGTPVQIN